MSYVLLAKNNITEDTGICTRVYLDESEMEEYLPVYQALFPDFTVKDMEAVRKCEYEWYDGTNSPYIYSDLD